MFGFEDPETFWLNVTNIALGVVTFVCLLVVGRAVVQELVARARKRAEAVEDDHAFDVPGLGITMADGGERLDATTKTFVSDRGSLVNSDEQDFDEPNIQRSEN